ncbi:class I tRNA ligase family protein, partial [Acinetobacter baumannii]
FDYDVNGRHPNYPFDFAVEMREQVRLWFYSTLVMGVVLEGEAPFKTVMTYDEMRDEKGERFSKTKGNAPSLDKIVGEYGADVLRYALAVAPT